MRTAAEAFAPTGLPSMPAPFASRPSGYCSGVVAMMRDQVRRARRVTLRMRPWPDRSNADHRALLAAIRAGDSDRARTLHHAPCTTARATLLALLERHQLRQI